jgi:hypothetical protein
MSEWLKGWKKVQRVKGELYNLRGCKILSSLCDKSRECTHPKAVTILYVQCIKFPNIMQKQGCYYVVNVCTEFAWNDMYVNEPCFCLFMTISFPEGTTSDSNVKL